MFTDILGWAALFLLIPATWFQILKNFRRKSTKGVSSLTFLSIFAGLSLFFILSLLEPTPLPATVQFGLGVVGSGIVLFQMAIYKKNS